MQEKKEIKQYYNNNELDLERIIEDFTPYISKIINNMVKDCLNEYDKEDVVSEVFFILWKNQKKLDKDKKMTSYLAGITKNVIREKLRKLKLNLDISDYENNLIDYDKIDFLYSNLEEISKIEKIVSKMKAIDKQIFLSFYYSSKSIKDIAKENHISEFNVKQRLYRIRNKIRKEVNKNG